MTLHGVPHPADRDVDTATGEIRPHPADRRQPTDRGRDDASARAWPPPSRGPLPPSDNLPPDLNIFTAQDEIDAWAWEHDWATEELARVRKILSGDPDDPHASSVEGMLIRRRADARKRARANPTERGRRTSEDITTEVELALEEDGIAGQHRTLLAYMETLTGRLFKAKDNQNRLYEYLHTLPRVSDHRPRP